VTTTPQIIVVTDANVLINLMHVARLDLCSRLPGSIVAVKSRLVLAFSPDYVL